MGRAPITKLVADSSHEPEAKLIGIAHKLSPMDVVETVQQEGWNHIVQKTGLLFDAELATARRITETPHQFLATPLEVICGKPYAVPVQSGRTQTINRRFHFECAAAQKKNAMMEKFSEFIQETSSTRRIADRAILVADELYTNSSKNAWPPGSKLFHGRPKYEGKIEFFAHADSERLVMCCKDSFGKLDINLVMGRLATCLKKGVVDSIDRGPGGAGIGSYLVFESCVSYYVGVQKNKSSVVCVVLPLGAKSRISNDISKNIHLVSVE